MQHAGFLVVACGLLVAACMWDLVPRPGIKPGFPALGAWSLTHWTTREVPVALFLFIYFSFLFFLIFKFNFIYFFIQQFLISHPFYTHQCIHVNPNHPIHHPTPHPSRFPPLVSIRLVSTSVSQFLPCKSGSSVPFF